MRSLRFRVRMQRGVHEVRCGSVPAFQNFPITVASSFQFRCASDGAVRVRIVACGRLWVPYGANHGTLPADPTLICTTDPYDELEMILRASGRCNHILIERQY